MALKLRKWDSAEYLKTEEDIALYFEACLEEGGDDPAFIAKILGNIARARGMTQLAKETGLGRESLYKALSGQGNPSFATILKVTHTLGLQFHGGAKIRSLPTDTSKRIGSAKGKFEVPDDIGKLVLSPTKLKPTERLARARKLRGALSAKKSRTSDISISKQQGRA